jgi:hypothetical protein
MLIDWPKFVLDEHEYFDNHGKCLNVKQINGELNLNSNTRFIEDIPPCFFAGKIDKAKVVLLSLNPLYNKDNWEIESRIIEEKGWEEAYYTLFEWFETEKIRNNYYLQFSVLLSGYLGYDAFPPTTRGKYQLLNENLVNIDLMPYHSKKTDNKIIKMESLLDKYIQNLHDLVELSNPEVIFLNGRIYSELLNKFNIKIGEEHEFVINSKYNIPIKIGVGKMETKDKTHNIFWLKSFLTSRNLHATYDNLINIGKELGKINLTG